jgi:hypothetical protein
MKKKEEKRTFYKLKIIRDWFWFRLEKDEKIEKEDLEGAFAQMAYYDMKEGGSGSWKRIRKDTQKIKVEAKAYNRALAARKAQKTPPCN